MRRYQQLAFRTAFLITREASDAEDVTQDAFMKAYRALPGFRPGGPFRSWLLKIVANEARNQRASAERRAQLGLRLAADSQADGSPPPDEVAVARERRRTILQAVNRLPEIDQLVIAYRYFLDMSEAEMAYVLECPRGTVKSRLARALGRLREMLVTGDADALDTRAAHD